jgi:hypothetical protein
MEVLVRNDSIVKLSKLQISELNTLGHVRLFSLSLYAPLT